MYLLRVFILSVCTNAASVTTSAPVPTESSINSSNHCNEPDLFNNTYLQNTALDNSGIYNIDVYNNPNPTKHVVSCINNNVYVTITINVGNINELYDDVLNSCDKHHLLGNHKFMSWVDSLSPSKPYRCQDTQGLIVSFPSLNNSTIVYQSMQDLYKQYQNLQPFTNTITSTVPHITHHLNNPIHHPITNPGRNHAGPGKD